MTPGTIDLGELPHGGEPGTDPRWSVRELRERLRRPASRRARRLVGATGVAALVLATAAAGAPAGPVPVRQVTVGATGYLVDGRTLYVLDRNPATPATLTAYRLADGGIPWQAAVPGAAGLWPLAQEGTLLVLAEDEGLRTIAFDAGSGRRRWSRDGYPLLVRDRLVLSRTISAAGPDGAPPGQTLTAVDPVTGAPEWTVTPAGQDYTTGSRASPYLVASGPDGRLTSYHLGTGERLATTPGPLADRELGTAGLRWFGGGLRIAGELAIAVRRPDGELDLTAYDAATFTRRWTRTDLPLPAGDQPVLPRPCGELVCLGGPPPPRALDPATGATVWSADWLPDLPAGDNTLGYQVAEPGSGRLDGLLVLSHRTGPGGEPRQWLVDAATGAQVLDLADWQLPVALDGAPAAGSPEPVLTWHADGGRVWLGRLRPDRSGVTPLVAVDAARDATCTPHLPYVLCAAPVETRADGPLGRRVDLVVWRFPP